MYQLEKNLSNASTVTAPPTFNGELLNILSSVQ